MHFTPPAYIDPNSGSVFFQLLVAALLGMGVAARIFWGKIKAWFGIKPKEDETDEDGETN